MTVNNATYGHRSLSCEIPEDDNLTWEDAHMTDGDESLREISNPNMTCRRLFLTPKGFIREAAGTLGPCMPLGKLQ